MFIRTTNVFEGIESIQLHEDEGVIFGMANNCNPDIETWTYSNMSDGCFTDLAKESILTGNWQSPAFYYLVRAGEAGKGSYYPLPLLFCTEAARAASAEEAGKTVPPTRWINRKRNQVLKELSLTLDQVTFWGQVE